MEGENLEGQEGKKEEREEEKIKIVKKHIHMVKSENIYSYICF